MKSLKLLLLGIAVILFGVCAILLSGLQGLPTYHNGIYEILGLICPIAGGGLAIEGFFMKGDK